MITPILELLYGLKCHVGESKNVCILKYKDEKNHHQETPVKITSTKFNEIASGTRLFLEKLNCYDSNRSFISYHLMGMNF
jgi:hypothetical protein